MEGFHSNIQCLGLPRVLLVLVLAASQLGGCATWTARDMMQKKDYAPVRAAHAAGKPERALANYPEKEVGGFITTVEKGWLHLLAGSENIDELRAISNDLEARQTLRISEATTSFFYKETEEGYYPAEHEAIALHLILSTQYARLGKREQARIEVARASRYLEQQYGPNRIFDDPFLRLWSAALWTYCGEWGHAQVDLRVAAKLAPDWRELRAFQGLLCC